MARSMYNVVIVSCVLATSASAQDSTNVARSDWLVGAAVGVPGYQSEALPKLFTLGVQATQLHLGRLGADVSLGTMPRALSSGLFVAGARLDATLPLAIYPSVLLLPLAGVSLLGGFGSGGGGSTAGLNTGVATVLLGTGSFGFRTGVTWHWLGSGDGPVWLWEAGLVHPLRK